jgi:trans-aconitate methyltransferase
MQNNWHKIWNNRQIKTREDKTLSALLAADGFDSLGTQFTEADWLEFLQTLGTKLKIQPGDSLFEVGCGGGAFLYPFYQQEHPVSGIDYSENLVEIARDFMAKATINVAEAINIPKEKKFDTVVSFGVFHYFPSYDYAAMVTRNMVEIANKSIGIFDLPDLSKKETAFETRKAAIGEQEYEEKYQDLQHLFYERDWFKEILKDESVEIRFENQSLANYINSQHRFNVFIHKTN